MKENITNLDPGFVYHCESLGLSPINITCEMIVERQIQACEEEKKISEVETRPWRQKTAPEPAEKSWKKKKSLEPIAECHLPPAVRRARKEACRFFYDYLMSGKDEKTGRTGRNMNQHRQVLGVPLGASEATVAAAYRALMKERHPNAAHRLSTFEEKIESILRFDPITQPLRIEYHSPNPESFVAPVSSSFSLNEIQISYDAFIAYFRADEKTFDDVAWEKRKQAIEEERMAKSEARESKIPFFCNTYYEHLFVLADKNAYQKNLAAQKENLLDFYKQLAAQSPELALFFKPIFEEAEKTQPPMSAASVRPSPTFALLALQHAVARGRIDLATTFKEQSLHGEDNFQGFRDLIENVNFCAPLYLAPEVFGDDFCIALTDQEPPNKIAAENSYTYNFPAYLLRHLPRITHKLKEKEIAAQKAASSRSARTRFSEPDTQPKTMKSIAISGDQVILAIYIDQYIAQKSRPSTIEYDIFFDQNVNLLGRVEWTIINKMVTEHRRTVAAISYESPHQLVSFNPQANLGAGLWIVNPRICDPLMARFQFIDCFFTGSSIVPKIFHDSTSKKYLALLQKAIIDPAYAELDQLDAKKKCSTTEKLQQIQLQQFLEKMEETISNVLLPYFITVEGCTLTQEITQILSVNREEALAAIEKLKTRVLTHEIDQAIFQNLYAAIMDFLQRCVYEGKFATITGFIEQFKNNFLDVLEVEFTTFLQAEYQIAKLSCEKQIDAEANKIIKEKASIVLQTVDALANNQKDNSGYGQLTETLKETVLALKNSERVDGGIRLQTHAITLRGKPSLSQKILGGVLMSLGVMITVVGILFAAATLVPTLGIGTFGGIGIAAGGVGVFSLGACFFRRSGLSKMTHQLGHHLQVPVHRNY